MKTKLVYVTAPTMEEAKRIGSLLVENRLAACANILSPVTSLFWWEGKIQEETECVLIAKTVASRVDALISAIRENHSYECPCIVTLPIENGNPDFLKWIVTETLPAPVGGTRI